MTFMSVFKKNDALFEDTHDNFTPDSKSKLSYQNWREENKSILSDFEDKAIMMLFTGGKDSSLILHYLQRASKEFGFQFQTHAADYPHNVFTDEEKVKLDRYWKKRGIKIIWHSAPESDEAIEEALNKGTNPCHICHTVKRKHLTSFVNSHARNLEKEIVIILSYTLWDLVSYSIEYITGAVYADPQNGSRFQAKNAETRFVETSQRFYPLIPLQYGVTIYKPLIKYNDCDIAQVVEDAGITLSTVECKYMDYRPKRQLSKYYKRLDLRFNYDGVYRFAKSILGLRETSYYTSLDKDRFLEKII
jgi:tRNA(Ile)-lysidine synthase TilS/MesJ